MAGEKKGYELFNQQELLQDMKSILTDMQKQGIDDELAERVLEAFQSSIRTYEMVLDAQSSVVENYKGEDFETKLKQEILALRQKNLKEHQRNNTLSKDLMSLRQKEEFQKFVDELWGAILENPPLAEKVFKIEFSLGEDPSKTQVLTKKVDFVIAHFLDVSKANEHFGSTLTKYATLANNAEAQADKSAKKAQKLEAKLAVTSKKLKDTYEAFEDVSSKWQDSNEQYDQLEKKTQEELAQAENVRKDLEKDLNAALTDLNSIKDELTSSESKLASSESKLASSESELTKVKGTLKKETKLRQAYENVYFSVLDVLSDEAKDKVTKAINLLEDTELKKMADIIVKEIVNKSALEESEARCENAEEALQVMVGDEKFNEYFRLGKMTAEDSRIWAAQTFEEVVLQPLENNTKLIKKNKEVFVAIDRSITDLTYFLHEDVSKQDKGILKDQFKKSFSASDSAEEFFADLFEKIKRVESSLMKYKQDKALCALEIKKLKSDIEDLEGQLEIFQTPYESEPVSAETLRNQAYANQVAANIYLGEGSTGTAVAQFHIAANLYKRALEVATEDEKDKIQDSLSECEVALEKLEDA